MLPTWAKDYNATGEMARTPIGPLQLVEWGHAVAVARVDARGRIKDIIHMLEPGQHPTNAICGKRTWESAAVRALYEQRDEREANSAEREEELQRRDARRAFLRWAKKSEDNEDTLLAYGHGEL